VLPKRIGGIAVKDSWPAPWGGFPLTIGPSANIAIITSSDSMTIWHRQRMARYCFSTMPRLRHFDDFGTARAVNFSCYHRHRLLTDEPAIRIFLNECDAMRKHYDIAIVGYVIMPSHVHLVLVPRDHVNLGHAIGELKSRSARRILALWRELQAPVLGRLLVRRRGIEQLVFWQGRCYDHNCWKLDGVREMIQYCHLNPVKAGLVADPGDWPWSSYRWYNDLPGIVLEIDGIEF